ncbi:hypothetical protein [Azospirillum sp. INR13]|uniref:hypothetical protein n=1 Tax=Azospirillum sp. INR13 TaxID=2596919 RepID=UPI0019D688DB|nr:hypothetical protein [Azospirillum sp. INR13]
MTTLYLSMAGFALAASISPGQRATLRHVADATLGFILLLVQPKFSLAEPLQGWPAAASLTRWAGAAFQPWMGWKLWSGIANFI